MITMYKGDFILEQAKRASWAKKTALKVNRAKKRCEICGQLFTDIDRLLSHHLLSLRNGGKDEDDNTIIVCGHCVEVIHALQAVENAEKVFKFDLLYMDDWELCKYGFLNILRNIKEKVEVWITKTKNKIKLKK
jgi:hypothetical protein